MQPLPEAVLESMKRLKQENNHYLSLKVINNRLYVYEATTKWDKENRKVRSISRYLGRMTVEGRFIPGIKRDAELGLTGAENIFNTKVYQNSIPAKKPNSAKPYSSRYEASILEMLSSDGRSKLTKVAKKLGLKPQTALLHKKNIDKKYGLRYIPELDLHKLGFSEYLILIKFEADVPSLHEIRSSVEKEDSIQLAMLTQGDYDVIIYLLSDSGKGLKEELAYLRGRLFPEYKLKLYLTPFYAEHGFVLLRDSFFSLLEKRASEDLQNEDSGPRISKRELLFLRSLNSDGLSEFSTIDKENGFGKGSSRYLHGRLLEKEIIKRVTISMNGNQPKYVSIILLNKISHLLFSAEAGYINRCIYSGHENIADKYSLVGETENPQSMLFILPVFEAYELDKEMEELRKVKGSRLSRMVVTNIVVGGLCYRRLATGTR